LKIKYLLFIPLLISINSFAQTDTTSSKLFPNGGLKIKFISEKVFEIAPALAWQFTPDFSAGTGICYQYYDNPDVNFQKGFTHLYGGKVFADYRILKNGLLLKNRKSKIYLHAEQEWLNYNNQYFIQDAIPGREWMSNSMAGLKFKYPVAKILDLNLMVLWRLNSDELSQTIQTNPVLKIGVSYVGKRN